MPDNLRDLWPAALAACSGLIGWLFGASREGARHTAEIASIRDQITHLETRLSAADASRGGIAERLSRMEGQLGSLVAMVEALSGGRK